MDNFARPQTNLSTWNGVQTQTGQYYYDVLGNLLVKGLGATGNAADPHLDYHFYRFDIRDQLTHNTSKHFRFGLKHDPQGNITDQYWSNELFDPTTSANVDINQYHYYYDDMNRLIGADYRSGTMTQNPFANFDQLFGSIPNDFLCGVNSIAVDEYLNPVFDELKKDIEDGINVDRNLDALNGLNMLRAEYAEMDIAYSQMTSTERDKLFTNYIEAMQRGRIDTKAYEMYRADKEKDDKHQDALNDGPMTIAKLKYTQILMSGVPYNASVQCDPNENATVYGFLPTFPYPTTVTNLPKYDAAYWYTENGNISDLNRNDEGGVKTEQDYSYNASNNQLSTVDWSQQGVPSETHAMSYDANGNILNETFVGTAPQDPISEGSPDGSFVYDEYDELPTSITIDGQTRNYRYDNNGQRIVKEVDANDKNYYLDGVVIDQNNEVISYQTPEGYVTVSSDVGTGLLISDYFYNVTDWLGTNRAIMDANGNILNAHDHYPFGKRMPGRHMVTNAEGNRYQYTGHEFDEETGYGYHGARYYNRELGRYESIDPLAEEYLAWSPYNYTMGNPINLIDPDGKKVVLPNKVSREQAITVLKDFGLDKDFRINKRGVLKKRFTPFSKDSEWTKQLSEKIKSRDIIEVSFTDKENWSVGNYTNSDLDIASQDGSGSARIRANYTYEGFPLLSPRSVTLLVISSNGKNAKEVAAAFVGGLLDSGTAENENKAREQIGIEEVESSSVKTLKETSPGGSKEQISADEIMPSAVNRSSSGVLNHYYQFIPSLNK